MLAIVGTVAPIFLLIVLGHAFKRAGFPGAAFWVPAERLAYYVLLPALVVHTLAAADLAGMQIAPMAGTVVLIAAVMTVVAVALRPALRIEGAAFTSVVQGVIRLNSYLAFAVVEAFFGAPGLAVAAVFVAVMMPSVNVISITALAAYAPKGRPDWRRVAVQVATNPLILACVIGAGVNVLGLPRPLWVMGLLAILSKAALPLALLCVGAGLDFAVGRARPGVMSLTGALKLAGMPAVAFLIGRGLGLDGLTFAVVVLFAAMPASPAAYVLSRQLGGDSPLMAGILTAETAAAALTLPAIIAWLGPG